MAAVTSSVPLLLGTLYLCCLARGGVYFPWSQVANIPGPLPWVILFLDSGIPSGALSHLMSLDPRMKHLGECPCTHRAHGPHTPSCPTCTHRAHRPHTSSCPSVHTELPGGTAPVAVHYLHGGVRAFFLRLGHRFSHPCRLQVRRSSRLGEGGLSPAQFLSRGISNQSNQRVLLSRTFWKT